MKSIFCFAIISTLFISCKEQLSRSDIGIDWIKTFAKEQFGDQSQNLTKFDIVDADSDSLEITYVVTKSNLKEESKMLPIVIYFNADGSVNDTKTREKIGL